MQMHFAVCFVIVFTSSGFSGFKLKYLQELVRVSWNEITTQFLIFPQNILAHIIFMTKWVAADTV